MLAIRAYKPYSDKMVEVAKKERFGCIFLADVAKPRALLLLEALGRNTERHGVAEEERVRLLLWRMRVVAEPLPCPSGVGTPVC